MSILVRLGLYGGFGVGISIVKQLPASSNHFPQPSRNIGIQTGELIFHVKYVIMLIIG